MQFCRIQSLCRLFFSLSFSSCYEGLHDLLGLGQQPVLAAAQAASVLLTQREEEKSGGGGESVHEAEVVHDVAVLLVNLQGRQESVQLVAIVAIVVVDPVNR